AYLETYPDDALREAAEADARRAQGQKRSPLDGVPIAVKDNLVMRGRVCSCASRMLASFRSPYDATVIQKLHDAGMPILGRLNMDEFAMGGSTENSAFGVTRNPWNLDCVPGGSSGGSAAAVAAGMAPAALGSDTGGSIRQPASFCGVVGVKPAYGAVSRYGLVAFASSLDQVGPLCKTAADAALVLDVICGGDPRDMTSDATLARPCAGREVRNLSGLMVGMPEECFGKGLDAQVRAAVEAAAETLRGLGAQVRKVSLPSLPYALPAYYVISSAEASSNLARYDGVRYGYRAQAYADLDELYRRSRQEGFGMEVKRRIMLGTFALSSGYQDQYYLKALKARELLRHEAAEALGGCAALLSPVAPTPAYRLGEKTGDPMEMYLGDIYTVPANITGLPAVSVPCGRSAEGLPIGMSLMGARDSLPLLMDIAGAYERTARVNEGVHPYDAVEGEARA
ncbi:MAG: Asp-tRNA(Asn)/Glu-tRNA(Gln) amidotransferase subunit GatA, partial [Clostridiales bacterium]|nr:Asp-tRNA(Asn)/Glu-tRNA(Gln) amidotransferase subunit GatA [Clostridiales bacterium]